MVRTSSKKQKNREYSTTLTATKDRVRRRHKAMSAELDDDIIAYYGKPVSEWDFEELQAGRTRGRDGIISTTGSTPEWITPAIMAEAQKRLKLMTRDKLGHYAGAAIAVMAKLMQNSRSDLVKFQAAKYVLDQIVGMPTQRVDVNEGPGVAEFMADFLVELDGRKHKVIEGEVLSNVFDEDDDEYDDEDEEDDE